MKSLLSRRNSINKYIQSQVFTVMYREVAVLDMLYERVLLVLHR